MAEKKAVGHAYNIDFLNVVFAASSIFLFISTIWMVWDDFDREWKNTQRQFTQLELEVTRAAARAERARHRQGEAHRAARNQLGRGAEGDGSQSRAHRRRQRPAGRGGRGVSSARTRRRSSPRRPTTSIVTRSKKSGRRNPEGVGERQKEIEAEAQRLNELNLEVQKIEAERTALQAELGKYTSEVGRLQKELDQINFEQNRLQPRRREHRAELRQGLLPQRAAARLHGADADRASGRHAERRRRRELRARDEDGSVHDVPSGHRSARLREVPAAVPDASEPVGVRRQRLAASAGDDRLHGVPPGTRRLDELQRRVALSEQREAAPGVGREVPLARAAHVGLPDAADEHDGSVVRAVPSAGDLRPERAEAGRRVCDVRARGLLRVPQDEGLREPAEARADPDEDQRQADAGLGEELGARSDARSRTSPGCRRSGTTRTATRRPIIRATRRRSTRRSRISSPTARPTRRRSRRRRAAIRRRASRSCARSGVSAATSSTRTIARRSARAARSGSR